MDFQFVIDYLISNLENVTVKNNKIVARCPICGDSKKSKSKKRFILQYDSDEDIYYRCWNCYMENDIGSGHFIELYAFLENISTKDAYVKLYALNNRFSRIKEKIISHRQHIEKNNNSNTINKIFNELRNDCIGIFDDAVGFTDKKYLKILKDFQKTRKIENEILFAYKGQYKNRIIIPIIESNNIVYFQARRTIESDYPKYINPTVEKQNIILNVENFNRSLNIIITEGIIDAFTIGKQGTTCLGASITDEFLEKLMLLTDQYIIIALDSDETGLKSVLNLIETSKYKEKLQYFIIPNKYSAKDINELSTLYGIENMYDFIVENSSSYYSAMFHIKQKINRLRTDFNNEDDKNKPRLLGDRWNELRKCCAR